MDATIFAVLILAVFLGYLIQTIVGFGGTLVALPLLLFVSTLREAVAILGLFSFLISVFLVYKDRKDIAWRSLGIIFVGSLIGVPIGTYLLSFWDLQFLKHFLGLLIIIYVIYKVFSKKKSSSSYYLKGFFSLLAGLSVGLYGVGGPFYVAAIYNEEESARVVRATIIGAIGIANFVRLPSLYIGGLLTSTVMFYFLISLPIFLISLFIGYKFYSKCSDEVLRKFLLAFLFIAGFVLLFN